MEKGEIFDLGFGEYAEYIEPLDDTYNLVVFYTKERQKPFALKKFITKIEKGYLEENCRRIGNNERARLLFVYGDVREENILE